ncbi:MAG: cbb3-type cytochrome oxidase assembly protein CcoS [Bdellovibrionales bacterium]
MEGANLNILILMIPISLFLGFGFLAGFIWTVLSGHMDDTETPAHRILEE